MKNIELIMMILILLVVVAGCAYVGWHVWCLVPLGHVGKWSLVGVLALCMVCFFSNFIFGLDDKPMPIAVFLYELGNSALFVGLYMAILFLVLDLARVLHIVPKSFLYDSWAGAVTVLLVIFGLFLYGNLHYHQKTRVPLAMKSEKPMRQVHRIVMLTDLHLGYHNRVDEFQRWVDKVNAEHPEVILIGGDIIDGSIRALEEQGMAAVFHKLQAPVYACLGNHEYYSGELRARKFYQDAGITLLIDRHAAVPLEGGDTLLVIGRDDRTNKSRASVQSLVDASPKGYFTILMDHQPYHLEEAQQAGIDFQLSGHTHYGQVWPVSWIEDLIYEDAFGPLQKGNTQYYVSSGMGIWGGKFRIGTRSEYVVAEVR